MTALDLIEADCPPDVVDRLLWRTAQRILNRHAVRLDGTCVWCARPAPCEANKLAVRAAEVARLPWHEAWRLRNEITGMLPVVAAELRQAPTEAPQPVRPVSRGRSAAAPRSGGPTRVWIRVRVVRGAPPRADPP